MSANRHRPLQSGLSAPLELRQRASAEHGFTLVEVLVAAALVAVVSTLSFMAIASAARTQEILQRNSERENALELMAARLRQDLFTLSPRSVRDSVGDPVGALAFGPGRSDYDLEFTRSSRAPLLVADTGLERAAYEVDGDKLYRYSWEVLDRVTASRPRQLLVLNGVRDLELRAFDSDEDDWSERWPPGAGNNVDFNALPQVVEVVVELTSGESLRILVPGVRTPVIDAN